jgi:hypothetical protein
MRKLSNAQTRILGWISESPRTSNQLFQLNRDYWRDKGGAGRHHVSDTLPSLLALGLVTCSETRRVEACMWGEHTLCTRTYSATQPDALADDCLSASLLR